MKIVLLAMGKIVGKHLPSMIADYVERVSHYIQFEITELPELRNTKNLSQQQQKEAEGDLLLKQISTSDDVILLDEKGEERSSMDFSKFLEKRISKGGHRIVFVVGGPYGFCQRLYDRANTMVSLSRMTFSHQMIRLIFAEQVYRAMTILKGEPYHHE